MEEGAGGAVTPPWRRETELKEEEQAVCVCEGGLSIFHIFNLRWTISKTDAKISFKCIWVLSGLAGRQAGSQAGTCCRSRVPVLIVMLFPSSLPAPLSSCYGF